MAIIAKASGGGSTPPSAGLQHAICYGIIDVGTQPSGSPQFKDARKAVFLFELPEERITIEGKDLPRGISATYTLSLGDKSKLRPALESWRGKPFTPAELSSFDITKVLVANCYLNLVHVTKGDKTYANVAAIAPLPRGIQQRKPENPTVVWSIADQPPGPIQVPTNIPEWVQNKIKQSHEYIDSNMQNEATPPSVGDAGHNQEEDTEDPPF